MFILLKNIVANFFYYYTIDKCKRLKIFNKISFLFCRIVLKTVWDYRKTVFQSVAHTSIKKWFFFDKKYMHLLNRQSTIKKSNSLIHIFLNIGSTSKKYDMSSLIFKYDQYQYQ